MITKLIEKSSNLQDNSVIEAKKGELELLDTFGGRG